MPCLSASGQLRQRNPSAAAALGRSGVIGFAVVVFSGVLYTIVIFGSAAAGGVSGPAGVAAVLAAGVSSGGADCWRN